MKSLIATALLFASFSTYAQEAGSVDSFLSVLPLGVHQGQDERSLDCTVKVTEANFPAKAISVSIENNKSKIFKTIQDGSEFLFRPYKQEFIQADRYYIDSTRSSYVERIIRTVKAGDKSLYIVVANETTVNRETFVEMVDCIVKL